MRLTKIRREELVKEMVESYSSLPASYFVEKYGLNIGSIYGLAMDLGVTTTQRLEAEKDGIISDYLNQMTIGQIVEKRGYSCGTISKKIKEWGVPFRDYSERNSRYEFDKNFFKSINTQEKAYWFGFVLADGNVYVREHKTVFQISLQPRDLNHIERLRLALKSNHQIYYDHGNPRFMINNIELVDDLMVLGLSPRKSLIVKFPSQSVPNNLVNHFIRGFFDGNGSIYIGSRGHWGFSITSTSDMLENISRIFIENNIDIKTISVEKRTGNGKIFSLTTGGWFPKTDIESVAAIRILNLYHFLYDGAEVWLDRKRNIFIQILNTLYKNDWK